jgi:hypothetical protein
MRAWLKQFPEDLVLAIAIKHTEANLSAHHGQAYTKKSRALRGKRKVE